MTEEQNELEIGIGTKEATTLKPAKVKIASVSIEAVGEKGNKKVVCEVKHPDKEELIKISAVAYRKANAIENSGTWLNQDEDKLIRKGSALAVFLEVVGVNSIKELEGKDADTELDAKGYLCFKAY